MKKSTPLEQNSVHQPRAGGMSKSSIPERQLRKSPKLLASRERAPVGLLAEHCLEPEAHTVSFEYFNAAAREVQVAGSFNDWDPRTTPMTQQPGGKWWTELLLKPGCYEYRLVVDGQWLDDPMATTFVANPFGGLNGVVEVKAITPMAAQP